MAYIRKLDSGRFQAAVRLKGLKPLYATFTTKSKAKQWALSVESDTAIARKLSVGDDLSLEQAVQVDTNSGSLKSVVPRFPQFVDEYIENTSIRDKSMIGRLNFWKDKFKNKLMIDITPEDIDDILLSINHERTGSTANRYKSNLSSIFAAFNRHPSFRRLKFPNPVRSEWTSGQYANYRACHAMIKMLQDNRRLESGVPSFSTESCEHDWSWESRRLDQHRNLWS